MIVSVGPIERANALLNRWEWVVSREFFGGGQWSVHQLGPNREYKLADFADRAQADRCADRLNEWMKNVLRPVLVDAAWPPLDKP